MSVRGSIPSHRDQTGSGAHSASYPKDNGSPFSGSKAVGSWSWPLTSIFCRISESVELYLHSYIRLHVVPG